MLCPSCPEPDHEARYCIKAVREYNIARFCPTTELAKPVIVELQQKAQEVPQRPKAVQEYNVAQFFRTTTELPKLGSQQGVSEASELATLQRRIKDLNNANESP